MSIDTTSPAMAQLQEAIIRIRNGVRDPEAAKRSAERMDRMREELRKKIGTVEVAVELIREVRDQ